MLGLGLGLPGAAVMRSGGAAPAVGPAYSAAYEVMDFAGVLSGGTPRYMLNGTDVANAAAVGYTGTGTFNASGYTATGSQALGKTQSISANQDFIILCEYDAPATDIIRAAYFGTGSNGSPQLFRRASGVYGNVPGTGLPGNGDYAGASVRNVFGRSGGISKQCFNGQSTQTGAAFSSAISSMAIGNFASDGSGANPWGVPIKRWVIWLGTYTDAQIAALAG